MLCAPGSTSSSCSHGRSGAPNGVSRHQPTDGDAMTSDNPSAGEPARVLILGAGFAGIGCAKELAGHDDVYVTLIDRHNYQQFTPLLYQVATAQLAVADVAIHIRQEFRRHENVDVKLAEVTGINPTTLTVTTDRGQQFTGDYLVLAAGGRANFFGTPGSDMAWPLYSPEDAERLRSRVIALFEDADREPSLV